jgi:Rrf2 family protein
MDIVRRNTDYAFRLAISLASRHGQDPVPARILSEECGVSYQLACKLLQQLGVGGVVGSRMGPKGGFFMKKHPSEVTLEHIIETTQGPLTVNCCMFSLDACVRQDNCTLNTKLHGLQKMISGFLGGTTLADLL